MPAPAKKKFSSKWFRIAVEGATTDGRQVQRNWIEEMAAQYSLNTYGARLNCEHYRSMWPDNYGFGAYGDVLALKAEEIEINGENKLALFAQIEPTESLIDVNRKGQKIYTSIEVNPKFADTGKAYLVGLAITDSPASLGTEMLEFSAKSGVLAGRKQDKDNLFTAAEAIEQLEFSEVIEDEPKALGLFNRVLEALGKNKDKTVKDDAQFNELTDAIEALATHASEQASQFAQAQKTGEQAAADLAALQAEFSTLQAAFAELKTQLEQTPQFSQQQRPPVTGGDGALKTQF